MSSAISSCGGFALVLHCGSPAVAFYPPPMTRNLWETLCQGGSAQSIESVAAQDKTGADCHCRKGRFGGPPVAAGNSSATPRSAGQSRLYAAGAVPKVAALAGQLPRRCWPRTPGENPQVINDAEIDWEASNRW